MAEIALSKNVVRNSSYAWLWVLFAAWFLVVLLLGSNNLFVPARRMPPLALLIASVTPLAAFFLSYSLSSSIREFILSADLKFVTTVQAWRLGGFTFLVLYSFGYLVGYFAWPAGVGDMLIGVTAPLVLARMDTPGYTKSNAFIAWNVLGILDLVVAVSLGALGSLQFGSAGVFPNTVMSQMPMVLIPTFFVPMFLILHSVALLQARSADKLSRA